jgi:hypothetical protein
MRAREFVTEVKNGKITKRQQFGTVGLHTFGDGSRQNSTYTLNRLMMALAAADTDIVPDIDAKSWVGNRKTSHPYTAEEQQMLKNAYRAVGAVYTDLNRGDLDSDEPPGGNTKSPIMGFRGYPR